MLINGKWYTPSEVNPWLAKKARKWKQSLQHLGTPLSEYNIPCSGLNLQIQQCSQQDLSSCSQDVNTLSQCNSDCSITVQNDNSNVGTSAGASVQSPMSNDGTDCPFIVDPVLSLIL